jgi:hypothetical protein
MDSDTPTDPTPREVSDSPKMGRRTLRMILSHAAEREAKNDDLLAKLLERQIEEAARAKKQMWAITVLLVLGLLASVGVVSAVKWAGTEVSFGEQTKITAP